MVSEKSTAFTFLQLKSLSYKIWPCRKKVIVNPESSFEQTMMGWSPRCYIPSFVEIGPLVLEKKTFDGVLPSMGIEADLVMWPKFISLYLRAYYKSLPQMARWFLWKASLNYHILMTFGHDLEYSHTFLNLNWINCLHLPTFRSQAAMVSVKYIAFIFFL